MKNKSNKILRDHKQIKKKFIPPIKYRVPGLEEVYWTNDILPELIWIAIIKEKLGIKRSVEVISSFISDSFSVKMWNHPIDFAFISSFNLFNEQEKSLLYEKVKKFDYYNDLKEALNNFNSVYPKSPLRFLSEVKLKDIDKIFILTLKKVITENFDRRSHGAMITQTIAYYALNKSGKVHYPKGFKHPDLNAIVNDFESENAKESLGMVRTEVSSSYMMVSKNFGKNWANYFWNQGVKIENPMLKLFSEGENDIAQEMKNEKRSILVEYISLVHNLIKERWNRLPKDIYNNHSLEVIGSLLSRQASIAIGIAENPGIWDFHIGPILLRTMVDAHINLAWVLTDPDEISKKFIDYGLGQEKLQIEHLKQSEVEEQFKEDLELMIEAKRSWLEKQHYSFLQTVDVGKWAGIDMRDMAGKAGCEGLYKYVYSPFSSCVHNMWNHIGKFNVTHSDNPLHKFIRVPYHPEFNHEVDILVKSAKYFSRSLELIDEKYNIKSSLPDPYNFLCIKLENYEES